MLLSVLKIIGLVLGALSGVIAALKDTKTPDKKHLTRAGKTLLVLGVLGFLMALGAQLKEWQEKESAAQASREQTERLLIQIKRAVTRLDTITIDVHYAWPIDAPEFAVYSKRINRIIDKVGKDSPQAGQTQNGLRVVSRTVDEVDIFSAENGSTALPHQGDGDAEGFYMLSPKAHVAIYKQPIAANEFSIFDDGKGSKPADMVLRPKAGKELVYFAADGERKFFPSYQNNGMEVPPDTWSPSGRVISVEDLNDCQAFVYLPYGTSPGVLNLWSVSPPELRFYFDRQPISIQAASLTLGKDHWGRPVYTFMFPHAMTP
jgi:hypothetical protein